MRFSEIKSICAVCGQTPCNCTHLTEGETPEKEIERLKLRQNAWRNPGLKHQADTQARIRELEKQIADKKQGVAEAQGSVGAAIKSLYQKIYAAGDDEIEYFYNDSPIFAQYWDEYEGDLDSIIAEVDPSELQVMLDELESYVQQANLEEGDVAKLAGITALGIGAGLGANYLDQQAPRVEFDGKNGQVVKAYLEPAWTNRIPDNAMTIKGKDGKTYHVWSSAGKGANSKSYHAAPVEQVKEGFGDVVKGVKRAVKGKEHPDVVASKHLGRALGHYHQGEMSNAEKETKRYNKVQSMNKGTKTLPYPMEEQGVAEVSSNTLKRYKKAAQRDIDTTDNAGLYTDSDIDRMGRRMKGIGQATSKINANKKKEQGVAEGSGDGYYYLQGGIERSKKFASEAEAMAHSKQFFQLARVSRVTLKYKEPGQPAVVVKEFTFNSPPPPKSQMSWGDFYLQSKKQGVAEGKVSGYKMYPNHNGTWYVEDENENVVLRNASKGEAEYAVWTGNEKLKQGVAEGKPEKQERPEADYGDDYQAMVSRVKKLAGLGPLKTVYDPQKRVYKNVPTAVQPGDKK